MLDVIGTCMQNFKKIDLKKNDFFIQSCSALFLLHTVQVEIILIAWPDFPLRASAKKAVQKEARMTLSQ